MLRKIFIYIFVISLILTGGALTIKFYSAFSEKKNNLSEFIPANTDLIIRFNKPFQKIKILNSNSLLWKNACDNIILKYLNEYILLSDSLVIKNPLLKAITETEEIILCISNISDDSFSWLLLSNSSDKLSENELKKCTEDYKLSYHSNREYKNNKIHKLKKNGDEFYIMNNDNILILSSSESLIELSFAGKNKNKILPAINNDAFANIIINNSDYSIANVVFKNLANNYAYEFSNQSNFDIYFEANILRLNGYTDYSNTGIFQKQDFTLKKYIVDKCEWFYTFSAADINNIVRNRLSIVKDKLYAEETNNLLQQFNSKYSCDIEKDILSWMDSEILLMNFEKKLEDTISSIILIKTQNYQQALKELKKLSFKTDSIPNEATFFSGLEINKIYLPDIFKALFGELFNMPDYVYYTVIDDVLVFSGSTSVIFNYIKELIDENYLYRDLFFDKLYSENYSDKISSMFYMNDKKCIEIFNQNIIFSKNLINSIHSFSWQTTDVKNNKVFSQYIFTFNFTNKSFINQGDLWIYKLQSELLNEPHIIYNHISQSYNILVQDEDYNIYLISSTGELLWKKQLEDKIIGKIFQIDILGNGKLQMLFSTNSAVHLIDIKGNYVSPFPYEPETEITAPAVAFDYDNDHQYRFLIPAKNKLINVDKKGELTQGWSFTSTKNIIVQSPYFFRVNAKDYIICNDVAGNLYVLDRKGKIRYDNKTNALDKNKEKFIYEKAATIEGCSFIYSDTAGNLKKTFFNGTTELLGKYSKELKFTATYYNNEKYFIIADSGYIYLQKKSDLLRSDKILEGDVNTIHAITGKNGLQIIVNTSDYAYILNAKLNLLQKISVKNNTSAIIHDINKDDVMEVIYSPGNRHLVVTSYK